MKTENEVAPAPAAAGGGKAWTKTRHRNLWRHKSGYFYIRLSIDGKQKWGSLGTEMADLRKVQMGAAHERWRPARFFEKRARPACRQAGYPWSFGLQLSGRSLGTACTFLLF